MEPSGAPWRALETPETPARERSSGGDPAVPWLAIGGALIAAAVALGAFLLAARGDPGVRIEAPAAGDASGLAAGASVAPSATDGAVVVEVGGAVARPGVYRLPAGARVGDAVTAAGGYGARVDADLADRLLNLAAIVHDGDEIHVPVRGEPAPGTGAAVGGTAPGGTAGTGPVDLNRASAQELDSLPGIGPVTAAKIIAARDQQPFASVDDLGTRKVVGASTLEKIRPLVSAGP